MSLSSTVQNLLNKDQDAKAVASDRDAVIEAWNGDIEAVFQSFRSALEDFVAAGTATITEEGIDVAEETLGEYKTQRLVISIVGRNIVLSPSHGSRSGERGVSISTGRTDWPKTGGSSSSAVRSTRATTPRPG